MKEKKKEKQEEKEDRKERENGKKPLYFQSQDKVEQFGKSLKNKSQMGMIYREIKRRKAQPKRHKWFLP